MFWHFLTLGGWKSMSRVISSRRSQNKLAVLMTLENLLGFALLLSVWNQIPRGHRSQPNGYETHCSNRIPIVQKVGLYRNFFPSWIGLLIRIQNLKNSGNDYISLFERWQSTFCINYIHIQRGDEIERGSYSDFWEQWISNCVSFSSCQTVQRGGR